MEEKLNQAKALVKTEPDEAMRICCKVIEQDPDGLDGKWSQMALFMIGYLMMESENYGLAYHMYKRCEQLNPRVSEIYSNMGMCLEYSDPRGAEELFKKSYKMKPDNASGYANEGLLCLQSNRPEKCIKLSQKALDIDPNLIAPKHNIGLAQIMLRQWEDGWKNYFDTLGVKHRERRDYGFPEWNGEKGKTILVYGEQGVGDEIMFASCLPDLMKDNRVILDTDSRLQGLFQRTFPNALVYGTRFNNNSPILDNHAKEIDFQCAIGQLPHFFRNKDEDFSGEPYLKPDPERCIQWKALFDTFKGKKVGIAWSGGLERTGARKRTLDLSDFEPLFNDTDTYISLEYKPSDPELIDKYRIKEYPRATAKGGNIDDLAAMVSQLDLVVTACTTVVYVAGALGIPCVVLVPKEPGYRYHKEGDFPWYNSVKLVRQKSTWKKCVEEAVQCLESL